VNNEIPSTRRKQGQNNDLPLLLLLLLHVAGGTPEMDPDIDDIVGFGNGEDDGEALPL